MVVGKCLKRYPTEVALQCAIYLLLGVIKELSYLGYSAMQTWAVYTSVVELQRFLDRIPSSKGTKHKRG